MSANSFDDVIQAIQEPEWRDAISAVAEKYPDLKGGWLRQSDYSRKLNELQGEVKLAERWKQWSSDNWDPDAKMTKAEAQYQQRLKDIEAENEQLKNSKEADMTFEQVQAQVEKILGEKTKGILTEETFKNTYGKNLLDKTAYESDVQTRMNQGFGALEKVYGATFRKGLQHKDEFGEVIDPLSIVEYANKNGIQDIEKAYDSMVAPRREEKRTKEVEERIAAAEKKGAEEARKNLTMGTGTEGRMPVDGGSPEMTHLQQRVRGVEKKDDAAAIPAEVKMDGSGKLAHHVAEQYRKDQQGIA